MPMRAYPCEGVAGMVSIRKELAGYGLTPRKKWGQNFLVDRNILHKIVREARIEKEDTVLEIGPGLGEMTRVLADAARRVIAIEVDPKLVAILEEKLVSSPNVRVIHGDVLKIDFLEVLREETKPVKVVANLPYQISTPLSFLFIGLKRLFSTLTLMVQKEVADRMVASPGTSDYGPLSIFIQLSAKISVLFPVKPAAFFPPPKVESKVVQINWREKPLVAPEDELWFREVVRGCLGYRRKTLLNALRHSGLPLPEGLEGRLEDSGLDPHRRPETFSIQELVRLAQ